MLFAMKYFLVVVLMMLLCSCETSRVKRDLLHGILDPVVKPIVDILFPRRDIPKDPNQSIKCPPPKTCPSPTCPPQTICPQPSTCPPQTTCNEPTTCPKPTTCPPPTTCPTPLTCPPPTTCPKLSTCPPETTCPASSTCPEPTTCPTIKTDPPRTCPPPTTCPPRRLSREEKCALSGALHCIGGPFNNSLCITTRLAKKSINDAVEKCNSLRTEHVSFYMENYNPSYENRNSGDYHCLSTALPASSINSSEIFLVETFGSDRCHGMMIFANGDNITKINAPTEVSCSDEYAFFCYGDYN